jgi:hypothetical protein
MKDLNEDDTKTLYEFIETNYTNATFYENYERSPIWPLKPVSRTVLQNTKY